MNTLELRPGEHGVEVRIDGRDLRELVRAVELPQATADGQPDLAGSYEGLPPEEWTAPAAGDRQGRVAVLGCTCGVSECWPLLARVTRRAGTVVWSDFRQPNRGWTHDRLGPFTFAQPAYDAAVAAVTARRR